MNDMGIYNLYEKYVNEELSNVLRSATEKGYKARFENPELMRMLLSTGNAPLQYESSDPYLGIGNDGRGANLVGITLMQIRHNSIIKKTEEEHENQERLQYKNIYDTYIAYTILRKEISKNRNSLDNYLTLNPVQIISKYGLKNIIDGIPSQDTIISLFKRDKLNPIIMKEIFQPGTLVINVRKNGIRQLQSQLQQDKDDIIFNSYLKYMIERKYKDSIDKEIERIQDIQKNIKKSHVNLSEQEQKILTQNQSKSEIEYDVVENIIKQQKSEIPSDQFEKLKSRAIELFKSGMLSATLSSKIDNLISKLGIMSDEDIEAIEIAEISVLPSNVEEEKDGINSDYSSESDESSDSVVVHLKNVFKRDDKLDKKELINMIIKIEKMLKIKGDNTVEYNKWVVKKLKEHLDMLEERLYKKGLIERIIEIKGGHLAEYNDWSIKELNQRLEALGSEILNSSSYKKELIEMIIKIKGGHLAEYNDWSINDLKERLDALDIENWGTKTSEQDIKPSIKGGIYIQPSGQPIGIFRDLNQNAPEFKPLAPEEFTGMLKIENRYYPTIQHYIIARLIASSGVRKKDDLYGDITFTKGVGIDVAYDMILVRYGLKGHNPEDFLTIQLTGQAYDKYKNETDMYLFSVYATTGLNSKFSDLPLQNLILLTGNKEILWNSPYNNFLGAGTEKEPGVNFVGKTMMDIRNKIQTTIAEYKEDIIELKDLTEFIKKDAFVLAWVKMIIDDMCGAVFKVQQYLKLKDGFDYNLDHDQDLQRLIRLVLDKIFQPCGALIESAKKNHIDVPGFIVNMVKKSPGMSSGLQPSKIMNNKGEYTWNKEISDIISDNNKRVNKMENEFWGGIRIEHTKTEVQDFEKHQQKELRDLWDELNASDTSTMEKNTEVKKFKEQQKEEYNEFFGINTTKKSNDDISIHTHDVQELKKELSSFLRKVEATDKHYSLIIKEISQIYWDRISAMLNGLIKILNKSANSTNVRNILVKVSELNSKSTNCVRIIDDEEENCIVSAILNLLVGIRVMKKEFSNNMEFDEDDVKLAGSIIMNTIFQPQIEEKSELSEVDEEQNDLDVGDTGVFPEDLELVDEEPEYEDNPYFSFKMGMGGKKSKKSGKSDAGDLDKVEQQLILISPVNSRNIAEYILKMVQTIKKYRMSPMIKQNRINFFATIL
jgi:predicted NAD-dependent protein-ADP-ribosyltransferase YbiA (DUF1768 family)